MREAHSGFSLSNVRTSRPPMLWVTIVNLVSTRRNARFAVMNSRVVFQSLAEQGCAYRGDFLSPIIGKEEEIRALRIRRKARRVGMSLRHCIDKFSVNIDRSHSQQGLGH